MGCLVNAASYFGQTAPYRREIKDKKYSVCRMSHANNTTPGSLASTASCEDANKLGPLFIAKTPKTCRLLEVGRPPQTTLSWVVLPTQLQTHHQDTRGKCLRAVLHEHSNSGLRGNRANPYHWDTQDKSLRASGPSHTDNAASVNTASRL